jgi:hypothetical protein
MRQQRRKHRCERRIARIHGAQARNFEALDL